MDDAEQSFDIGQLSAEVQQLESRFGYVKRLETANIVIREYETLTVSKFSCYKADKNFGHRDLSSLNGGYRIHWEDRDRSSCTLKFDRIPYIILGVKLYDCHHGIDRQAAAKRLKVIEAERAEQHGCKTKKQPNTKKFSCKASIKIREILKFPEFQIVENTVYKRKLASNSLRAAVASSTSKMGEKRLYIHLPSECDHTGHLLGEGSCISQPLDSRIIKKVFALVDEGVRDISVIETLIRRFVADELFIGREPPSYLNKRFHPSRAAIRDHANRAKSAGRARCRIATSCRDICDEISNLTYRIHDVTTLSHLELLLKGCLNSLRFAPQEDGVSMNSSRKNKLVILDKRLEKETPLESVREVQEQELDPSTFSIRSLTTRKRYHASSRRVAGKPDCMKKQLYINVIVTDTPSQIATETTRDRVVVTDMSSHLSTETTCDNVVVTDAPSQNSNYATCDNVKQGHEI
ncbi:PREDICTED: uncharacterized protein LOC106809572 [Priapulus caudatus]|uniref:Uncharacterized protein LOC106809572 n=1 Tax=Priapulus caudatus TaxID=37621 RepID=A0ABM1E7L0_PRICU|nr:PREDICTED: uncharacterized protein LOC106809572 [Priapulus caudatus]XP_014668180.1 PREDICTED: uncharacterized protein LOC106809572 [Priapulus caudatus]XP_014668181.1 PREDICTED: uncharacterized protein LOC106809572 [Priapulus caudatus]XP_014668182.1 PREDICTED: uncharacterized protein LOC106809572 [Priapulus caudatus]XP_014668183.1 PREDICTED: uncharacterized protein LOC106809572 [Priapulus caudatus]XP_014668185.1 PREDICTED: uncharacterized protein LOC106809572 [Priapulus caudatus]